ncbi:DegT/DnrJ/EryC1/StrS family aminotransferase [candidate division KSB1 bacterium]
MQVPIIDVKRQLSNIRSEIDRAITDVLQSGQFILGPAVKKFEREVCEYIGASHSIGCASGTDALMIALMGIGICSGDEVITTPFTFVATAEVIAILNAKPVFVDINPETYNIDVEKIESVITEKTKAILPVHLFGRCAEMDKINVLAEKHGLKVIEDCAQAFGANYKGKKAGALSDVGCFSFYPTKNLNAFGDGGMITANSDSIAENIRIIASHGSKEKYNSIKIGVNSRLDSIQAACLSVKLKYINRWNGLRIKNAKVYNRYLKDTDIIIPSEDDIENSIFHQYSIRVKNRDEVKKYLSSKGIMSMIYYPIPLHLQDAYKYLGYKNGDFPVSENISKEILSLPMFPELTEQEIKYITDEIKNFLNQK